MSDENANNDPLSSALGITPIQKTMDSVSSIIADAQDDSALKDFARDAAARTTASDSGVSSTAHKILRMGSVGGVPLALVHTGTVMSWRTFAVTEPSIRRRRGPRP